MQGPIREGGPFTIEAYCAMVEDRRSSHFEVVSCAVVYADNDQPSHSVRIFKFKEEN